MKFLLDTHLDKSQCMLCKQLVNATRVVTIKSQFPLGMHYLKTVLICYRCHPSLSHSRNINIYHLFEEILGFFHSLKRS